MYHPTVVSATFSRLMAIGRMQYPTLDPPEYTPEQIDEWIHRLDALWDVETSTPLRPLTDEENLFIVGQTIRCRSDIRYWITRFVKIRTESGKLSRVALRRTQQIILKKLGEMQLTCKARNDGILALILKARQLGVSTLAELIILYIALFYSHRYGLIASDVPEASAYLFGMIERVYENLPWWIRPSKTEHVKNDELVFGGIDTTIKVGWGNATRGQKGAARARLAQGTTINMIHCSELSTWNQPQQLDSSVSPALPRNPNTFGIYEGTALGRGNWMHDTWQAAKRGNYRFKPIFIPWIVEVEKYAIPAPLDWQPTSLTLAHGDHVSRVAERWCGIHLVPTKDQLYWYETERENYTQRRQLHAFLAEFAADDDEAFQHSGVSAFSPEKLSEARQHLKPMLGMAEVRMDPTVDWTVS